MTSENTRANAEKVVTFGTGATRSTETAFDPEGFISPGALAEYCRYMAEHRVQADGKLRDSDNWQKGMPTSRAFRSLNRHHLDAWLIHRGYPPVSADCSTLRGALCGIIFNALLILKNEVVDRDSREPEQKRVGFGSYAHSHLPQDVLDRIGRGVIGGGGA